MADEDLNEDEELEEDAEGAGDGEEGEEEEGGGGFNAKKIVLFVVAPIVLLIAVGGGLYFTGVLDGLLGKGAAQEEHADEDGHGKKDKDSEHDAKSAHFLKIPNMVVNLSSDGQPRYLRLSVQLELESEEDVKAVEAVMPRVIDQFQTYLRELRVKDLRGSAGIYRLQMELLSRVNAAAYPVEVQDVLFQEILIQ